MKILIFTLTLLAIGIVFLVKYLRKKELGFTKFGNECDSLTHIFSIFYIFKRNGTFGIATRFGHILFDGYSAIYIVTERPYLKDEKTVFFIMTKNNKDELRTKWFRKILSDFDNIQIYKYHGYGNYWSSIWYFYCQKDSKWGLYSTTGKKLIPCIYDDIHTNIETVNVSGLIHETKKILIHSIGVKDKNGWGILTKNGKTLIPCGYTQSLYAQVHNGVTPFYTGKKGTKFQAISYKGKILTPWCDNVINVYNCGICIKDEGLYHFVVNGKTICSSNRILYPVGSLKKTISDGEKLFSFNGLEL